MGGVAVLISHPLYSMDFRHTHLLPGSKSGPVHVCHEGYALEVYQYKTCFHVQIALFFDYETITNIGYFSRNKS